MKSPTAGPNDLPAIPQELIETVNELRGPNGELPSGLSIVAAKDWRVLVSGISFGLLFLAAAGALFAQHGRQTETLLQLGRDVDYFDALVSAAEIRRRADLEALAAPMERLVEQVISQLLDQRHRHPTKDKEPTGADELGAVDHVKGLTESIKRLKT